MARPSLLMAQGGPPRVAGRLLRRLASALAAWVAVLAVTLLGPALLASSPRSASALALFELREAVASPLVELPDSEAGEEAMAERRAVLRAATRKVPQGFTSYEGGWITIAYPLAMRAKVQPLIAESDRFRGVLSAALGQPVLEDQAGEPRVWVMVGRTPGEMASFAPEGAPPPSYASGVAYSQIGLVLLTIDPVSPGAVHSLEEVFRHELSHVAMYDATQGEPVPSWFNEGFAVHISGESSLTRLQTLWTATVAGRLLPLSKLTARFPADSVEADVAYAQSADVVRYLLRAQDTERFHSLIARMRPKTSEAGLVRGQPFEEALTDAYGKGTKSLEYEWLDDVQKRYTFWPVAFSGSFVWVGALVLLGAAWRKRRRHQLEVMARWEREEAAEAEARALVSSGLRVHLVMPGSDASIALRELVQGAAPDDDEDELEVPEAHASPSERGVPKVRHEGSWYTLH